MYTMRPIMSSYGRMVAVVLAGGAVGSVAARAATPVFFPTTGSYYEVVDTHSTWTAALSAAAAKTFQGRQGRLATITSDAENSFVVSLMTGANDSYWVGGYQDHSSPSYSEPDGGWRWITDEPFTYTHWRPSPKEPSEFTPGEDFLEVIDSSQNGYWNDLPDVSVLSGGYIIEYPAPAPEPASLLVLGAAGGLMIPRRRRRV